MYAEQFNNVVEVNEDFWRRNDYMRLLDSGVPLYRLWRRVLEGCLKDVWKMSGRCLEGVWKVSGRFLEGVCHTRIHLGFSAKLIIWQVPTCNMEPRSGNISLKKTVLPPDLMDFSY